MNPRDQVRAIELLRRWMELAGEAEAAPTPGKSLLICVGYEDDDGERKEIQLVKDSRDFLAMAAEEGEG